MSTYLAWALGSGEEASNGEKIMTAVWGEVSKGQPGENAQLRVEHESGAQGKVEADVGALSDGIGTVGLARAGNCRRNIQGQGVMPKPAPWGKPGSAEWAGEGSREESEEEPFQEGREQGPRQDSVLRGAGSGERGEG